MPWRAFLTTWKMTASDETDMQTCFGLLFIMWCEVPQPAQINAARFCEVAEPKYWSRHDTPTSIAQDKRHNAKGAHLCGWGKK
jgi:hypothetical protein